MKNDFSQWLERKYIEWQAGFGERKTIEEFADWLGFKRAIVTLWMNGGRTPGQANADKLAYKLGKEVYTLLGLPPNENRLVNVQANWDYLTPAQRQALADLAEQYAKEPGRAYGAEGLARPEPAGIDQRIVSKFANSWKNLTPEMQREVEGFFGSISAEEFAQLFIDVIRLRLSRGKRGAPDGDPEPGEGSPRSRKGSKRQPAKLQPDEESAGS